MWSGSLRTFQPAPARTPLRSGPGRGDFSVIRFGFADRAATDSLLPLGRGTSVCVRISQFTQAGLTNRNDPFALLTNRNDPFGLPLRLALVWQLVGASVSE